MCLLMVGHLSSAVMLSLQNVLCAQREPAGRKSVDCRRCLQASSWPDNRTTCHQNLLLTKYSAVHSVCTVTLNEKLAAATLHDSYFQATWDVLHLGIDLPIFNISKNNGIQWCYWPSSCVYVMVLVSCCNTEQRSPSNDTSIVSEHSDESEVWGFFFSVVGVQHWAACKHFFSCLYWYKTAPPWWIPIPEYLDFSGEWLYMLEISSHGCLGMHLTAVCYMTVSSWEAGFRHSVSSSLF